ncbi:hypothetical protein ACJMK2_011172 [Sinanodonta woodiana]|uniref:CARD domain-containing protein n=1 Tax=Sinanodonta woodiana TaxID=1069815 RepID=A0ABD3V4B4_SINWO
MDSVAEPLMSPKIINQDINSRLDILTNCVQALQLDVAAIKNVVCCSATLPRHDKQNSVEDCNVADDSTVPKIPFYHASQVDSVTQPRISQTEPAGEKVNQQDLNKQYCISKAIQKNITKLIDVLPYQTSKLQDFLLQSESCLTENENDLIKKQPTRRDQIRQLIRFIKGRSFKAISKFLHYSRDYSPEVIDLIWKTYDQLMSEGVKEKRCIYCRMTNAVDIKDVADYAYEKEVLSDELHQQMTDCMHGVGAQTQLWHQLSVLSLKDSNNKILMESILTYLCSTPKYKQYGEELKVLVKRNFRFECRCKDYKRHQMYNCNREESFTSSILSSSVCPTSTISDLTPRQSLRSQSSTSSGNERRKQGKPNVKNFFFIPNNKRRVSKRQVSTDIKENTSPKYIHCTQDKVSDGESTALPSIDGTNSEETDLKMCIDFLDSKYTSQLSRISSRTESIESHEKKNDTEETTLKSVHIAGNNEGAGGGINRGSATRNTWPLQPRSFFHNTEGNFEDSLFDVSKVDDEKEALVHSLSDYEDCSFSNKVPQQSIFENLEYLRNHIPGGSHEAILPSDRHETLPTFLQDVLEENQRTSGTEDKVCLSSLKRTNSIPASLSLSSQTVSETESTSSSSSSPLQDAEGRRIVSNRNIIEEKDDIQNETNLSWETETKKMNLLNSNTTLCEARDYDHSGKAELDAKFKRNQYTDTSSDFHIESSKPTTFSDLEITNCCPSGESSSLETQNTTGRRTYTVHRKYNSASESDASSTANVRHYTAFRKNSESLSDTTGDATKEKRLHFGSLGRKVRDSVRMQRTINNRFHDFKTTKKC